MVGKWPDWYGLPVRLEPPFGVLPPGIPFRRPNPFKTGFTAAADVDPDEDEAATLLPLSLPLLLKPTTWFRLGKSGLLNGLDG